MSLYLFRKVSYNYCSRGVKNGELEISGNKIHNLGSRNVKPKTMNSLEILTNLGLDLLKHYYDS